MKRKLVLATLVIVVCMTIFTGCVIKTGNTDGNTAIEMSGSGDIDSLPGTLNATKGSTFGFKLEANPTTGYTWQVYIEDEEIVKLAGNEYDPDDAQADGSGGLTTLTFKALEKGETKVKIEYARDWEGGEVDKTKEITIIVE